MRRVLTLVLLFCAFINGFSQSDSSKFELNGYVSSMQSAMFDSIDKKWTNDNLLHNRLNFKYFVNKNWNAALELRNRLAYGDGISSNPNAAGDYSSDKGRIDLSSNIAHGNSYVLNTAIDRAYVSYESGKLKATLGRQRINWGQTFVWNPNDIFNAYSFFDFDYVERPGSDAIRLQYYNTETSSTEIAVKTDAQKQITAAALYKFNAFEYDFQVLGGILSETDYVAGGGWSGAIKSLAIRGEFSYFHPMKHFADTSGIILASLSVDYTLANSLTLMAEYLFTNNNMSGINSFLGFYNAPLTVKSLSFVKHNLVVQASYPISPLLTGSMALMYLPGINGYYLSPSLSYNMANNVDASIFYQGFGAELANSKQRINMLFLRLKLSF